MADIPGVCISAREECMHASINCWWTVANNLAEPNEWNLGGHILRTFYDVLEVG